MITGWVLVWAALAGGLGACLRYLVDLVVRTAVRRPTVWGTVLINVSGSFVLGLLTGWLAGAAGGSAASGMSGDADAVSASASMLAVVGVGLLGGYTTFSTASIDAVRLAQRGRWGASAANACGTLIASVLAAGIGLAAGSALRAVF